MFLRKSVQYLPAPFKGNERLFFGARDVLLLFLLVVIPEPKKSVIFRKAEQLPETLIVRPYVFLCHRKHFFPLFGSESAHFSVAHHPQMIDLLQHDEFLKCDRTLRSTLLFGDESAPPHLVFGRIRAPFTGTFVKPDLPHQHVQDRVPHLIDRQRVAEALLCLEQLLRLIAYRLAFDATGVIAVFVPRPVYRPLFSVLADNFLRALRRQHLADRPIALCRHQSRILIQRFFELLVLVPLLRFARALKSPSLYQQHEHRGKFLGSQFLVKTFRSQGVDISVAGVRDDPVFEKYHFRPRHPVSSSAQSPARAAGCPAPHRRRLRLGTVLVLLFRLVKYPGSHRDDTLRFAVFVRLHYAPTHGCGPDIKPQPVIHRVIPLSEVFLKRCPGACRDRALRE